MSDVEDGGDERHDLLAAERQLKIASLFGRQEFATHTELLAVTGSSLSTLRRDLRALERTGVVRRIRGGAARPEGTVGNYRNQIERLLVQALASVRAGDVGAAERCVARALQAFAQLPQNVPTVEARDRAAQRAQRFRARSAFPARRL
jgi:DNA-binding transcriptional ArsR family regulator